MRSAAIAIALVLLTPRLVRAQDHAAGAPEAQLHFERGLSLADDSNYAAAMVEFRYAYGITHNPLLLYNIALAHQAMGHYVEALEAMQSYESDATAHLTPARRSEVHAAIDRLRTRIGTLLVPLPVPGLDVRVDGVSFDAQHAHRGIPLSVGTHLVSVRAPGFETREQPIDIVSGVVARVDHPLAPVTSGFTLECNVAGAEVRVDGRLVGRTPTSSVIAVPAGHHHVEVAREGYQTFATDLDVSGPGVRVVANLALLETVPAAIASHVRVDAHPDNTHAWIDGRLIAFDGRDALPPGPHYLRIERADFTPIERQLELAPASMARVEAWLQPTSFQAERLERRRAVSGVLAVVGAAFFAGGVTGFVFSILHAPDAGIPVGWQLAAWLIFAPGGISGLVMGSITGVRYLTQATAASYRPPRGHETFRLSAGPGGITLRWY
jgi:hypothetical protein